MVLIDCILNRIVSEIRVDVGAETKYLAVSLFSKLREKGIHLDPDYIENWLVKNRPHFLEGSRKKIVEYSKGVTEGRRFVFAPEYRNIDDKRIDHIFNQCLGE